MILNEFWKKWMIVGFVVSCFVAGSLVSASDAVVRSIDATAKRGRRSSSYNVNLTEDAGQEEADDSAGLSQEKINKHVQMLQGDQQEQKMKALAFFADQDRLPEAHKANIVKAVVNVIVESIGSGKESDSDLQYRAVRVLQKHESKALHGAFRTLSMFTLRVYEPVSCQPAISGGTIYFYSRKHGALIAMDLDTWTEKWRNEDVSEGTVVCHQGIVLCGSVAVDAENGEVQWRHDKFKLDAASVVPEGDMFYFAPQGNQYVVALNATNGEEEWVYDTYVETVWQCQPLVTDDTLYILTDADRMDASLDSLYAINVSNGKRRWVHKFKTGKSQAVRLYKWQDRLYFEAGGRIACVDANKGRVLGYSGVVTRKPIVVADYLCGYKEAFVNQKSGKEHLPSIACLDLKANKGKWRLSLGKLHENSQAARKQKTVREVPPAGDGDRVYFFLRDPAELLCMQPESGGVHWRSVPPNRNMTLNHAMTVYNERLYLAPKNSIMEVDAETGNEVKREPPSYMR